MKHLILIPFAVFSLVAAVPMSAWSAELHGVKMDDEIQIDGKKLVLNGLGVRKASIFHVKVYVAGLYVEKKSQSENDILESKSPKKISMEFVHLVEKQKLVDAWQEGFDKNCTDKPKCDPDRDALKKFANSMEDMREHNKMSFTFHPDKVEVEIKGAKKSTFEAPNLGQNLLKIFLGPKPSKSRSQEWTFG